MTEASLTQRHVRILLVLADQPRHGYAISKAITEETGGDGALLPGSLYRALSQLERRGLIEEIDGPEVDPRRRPYRVTPSGRDALAEEVERMRRLTEKARRLGVAGQEG